MQRSWDIAPTTSVGALAFKWDKRERRGKRVNPPYRPYSHPNPSKVIFSNKIQISKKYVLGAGQHISLIFFSLEICVTRSFRN